MTKGCGIRSDFVEEFKENAKFNSERECYVTDVVKNNKVVKNIIDVNANETLLTDTTSTTTSTSVQQELCLCEGSKCNSGNSLTALKIFHFGILLLWIVRT